MKQNRIEQLEKYLSEDPNDAFSKYALAMELKDEDEERTIQLYDDLLSNHPEYGGTYYHAANFFSELGDRDKAEFIYIKGLEVLEIQQDYHGLRELKNAYQNFQFEDL